MSGKTKRRMNWAIPGLFAMIAIIVAIAWVQSVSATSVEPAKLANQCGSCHAMDEHVTSWQQSAHKDVACTECHADPGVMGWVKMQQGRIQMALSDRKGDTDLHKIATTVPNERCLDCHARQMPWVMQDLQPPQLDAKGEPVRVPKSELEFLPAQAGHDLHLTGDKPLNCTECHKDVSHGPAQQPEKVADWHNICLDCHAKQNVQMTVRTTISCSACHVDLEKVAPADHKTDAFRESHGKNAVKDTASCQQCHLNPGMAGKTALGPHTVQPAVLTDSTAPVAAQTVADTTTAPPIPKLPPSSLKVPEGLKDSCTECHGLTMPHPADWVKQHTKGFQEKPELCATCHGNRDQGLSTAVKVDPKTVPTTDTRCTACHAQPMPHPEGYAGTAHEVAAKLAPVTCEQCHSAKNPVDPTAAHATPQFCLDCHLRKASHPEGYVASHKLILASFGNNQAAAGCTQCHTPTQNSCTTCHKGGVSSNTQWHPADWVGTHGQNIKPSDAASCNACHTYVQPTCTSCHTNGVGAKTQWHPDNWWVTHAQTTKPADKAACNKCHAVIQPSCAKCHSSF